MNRLSGRALVAIAFVLATGVFLRVWPSASFNGVGIDEHNYASYVEKGVQYGLMNYGRVVDEFIADQVQQRQAVVPATRIGFIWPAMIVARLGDIDSLRAVHLVSLSSAILLLVITAIIGFRLGGPSQMLIVTALMATAPLQMFLAQRALGDEYFALWAVLAAWCFLEALESRSVAWMIGAGVSVIMLVLTKENAAFVCTALLATWVCFSLSRLAPVNFTVVCVMVTAAAVGVLILASLLGGITEWITFYRMYARKSSGIPYVALFQDGAWYRYLVDFIVLSPLIVVLALGRMLELNRKSRTDVFWALFLTFSFVVMSSIRYGMSLRFAAYWDEPLRWLAASQIAVLRGRFPRYPRLLVVTAVTMLLIVDLSQYYRLFVKADIYDPVSWHLLRASKLVK